MTARRLSRGGRAWRIALTEDGAEAASRCRQVTAEWFEGATAGWPRRSALSRRG
ncbi:hypothetical protein [Nonomuraea sp. B5E05]|uniref:hypothetical protein n=1 Tax=Nonomuraea sp. B5E05 TaxID=3153569 RepID=UPI00325FF9E5